VSGWLVSLLLALLTGVGLVLVARPQRSALQLVAAALLLGLAGYAWQGSPALQGKPTPPSAHKRGGDTLFAHERKVWLETVGSDALALDGADSLIRNGDPDYAAGLLRSYSVRAPNSMMLWLGLGNALQAQADGIVTPSVRYAIERAAAVAPRHPAPRYFLGLAYLQMGDVEGADKIWRDLLANTPADAPWRARLAARVELLDRFRAAAAQR
jgi:predicted Zn-dependent protease